MGKEDDKQLASIVLLPILVILLIQIISAATVSLTASSSSTNTNVTANATSFSHLSLNDSVVVYFSFDGNTSSTVAYDYSNHHNDGTLSGVTFNESGFMGRSATFSVSSGTVSMNFAQSLNISKTKNVTLAMWVNPHVAQDNQALVGTQNSLSFVLDTNKLRFFPDGDVAGGQSSTFTYTAGQWIHLAVTHDYVSNRTVYYLNGANISNETVIGESPQNQLITLGKVGSAFPLNASMDEFMWFNRTLNTTEINSLYLNQSARFFTRGEQSYDNLNFQQYDILATVFNISVTAFHNLSSNITLKIGFANATAYNYSSEYTFTNGSITNLNLSQSSIGNISLKLIYYAGTNAFYSPILQNPLTLLLSRPVSTYAIRFVNSTPVNGSTITANALPLNASVSNTTDISSDARTYGFFDVNNSLVAWWTMDEGTVNDISGNGYDLTLFGNATKNLTDARFGASLQFSNETTDYARTSSSTPGLRLNTSLGFTISLWVNPKQKSLFAGELVSNNAGDTSTGFTLRLNNESNVQGDSILLYIGNGTGSNLAESHRIPISVGNWSHIVVTFYRDTAYFYVNGTFISARPFYQNISLGVPSDSRIYLGLPVGSYRSQIGKLDDVLLFSRPLASEEISSLYTLQGTGNRSFSSNAYGLAGSSVSVRSFVMPENGDYALSNISTFTLSPSGPYIISANYSYENMSNFTTLSAYISPGMGVQWNMSQFNGSAYYRVNNGSWVLINGSTYLPYRNSSFGGLYGDSFTGFGTSIKTWDNALDGIAHTYFWGSSLKRGVAGSSISQIRSSIVGNATNGTAIFLQGGTNDITGGWSDQGIINNYSLIFNSSRAKNLTIYLANIIPRNSTTTNANVTNVNTWLYNYYLYNNSDRVIAGFTDVYSALIKNSTGRIDERYTLDGLHPNDAGIRAWADVAFRQGYHYKYHDGFYTEFVPSVGVENATYDLMWNISTPTGESTSYEFTNVFFIQGTYNSTSNDSSDSSSSSTSSSSRGGASGFAPARPATSNASESSSGSSGGNDNGAELSPSFPVEPEQSFVQRIAASISGALSKTGNLVRSLVAYPIVLGAVGGVIVVGIGAYIIRRLMMRRQTMPPHRGWMLWHK